MVYMNAIDSEYGEKNILLDILSTRKNKIFFKCFVIKFQTSKINCYVLFSITITRSKKKKIHKFCFIILKYFRYAEKKNVLPFKTARLAPPPVLTYDTLFSHWNFIQQVAVSPPPEEGNSFYD